MAVERALRDDMLGAAAWGALDSTVRSFIATGEKIFREHRSDPSFDFTPVLASFAKAIEVQLNVLMRRVLPKLPRQLGLMNVDGHTADALERGPLMMAALVQLLAGDEARSVALAAAVHNGGWLTREFAAVLDQFREIRNEGIHSSRIDCRTATHWRNQLLGVGCVGHVVELAKVRLK